MNYEEDKSVLLSYDYLFDNGDWGDIVFLSIITYLVFIDRNGKLEEE